MAVFNVVKQCTLSLGDGTKHIFEVGMHEVEDALANHWFFRAHTREGQEEMAKATETGTAAPPAVIVRKPISTVTVPVDAPAPAEAPAPAAPAATDAEPASADQPAKAKASK